MDSLYVRRIDQIAYRCRSHDGLGAVLSTLLFDSPQDDGSRPEVGLEAAHAGTDCRVRVANAGALGSYEEAAETSHVQPCGSRCLVGRHR